MASGSRETLVWCMIYDDLEYTEEADIFANQMTNVKPLQAYEIFNASCEAGSSKELMIKGLVESYDLRITSKTIHGGICAVGALISIFDRYGYETLDRVIHLIVITWEGEQKSFSANMMNGVARLIYAYGAELKDNIFKKNSAKSPSRKSTRLQKSAAPGPLAMPRQC